MELIFSGNFIMLQIQLLHFFYWDSCRIEFIDARLEVLVGLEAAENLFIQTRWII